MGHLRRLFAYSVCVAVATPPMAYGQTTPTNAVAQAPPPAMTGVGLSASQTATYARLMMKWPAGSRFEANGFLSNGIALIRLPRPLDVDPSVYARSAPQFIAAAALSGDKKTIRIALVQNVRLDSSRSGDTQVFDLVQPDAPKPPPLGRDALANAASTDANATPVSQGEAGKMVNSPAPEGAPRVEVQTAISQDFTRIRLTNAIVGAGLPAYGYARNGDRIAIAMPGSFALDIASLRAQPPRYVRDGVRYSSATDTSLVLDLQPGSVVRHSRDGDSIVIDILPAGANPNSVQALQAQAAASVGQASPTTQQAARPPAPITPVGPPPSGKAVASALVAEQPEKPRGDPAPSGRVIVKQSIQGNETILEFGFEAPAPAVVFRRGEAIYALFATNASFDISKVKSSPILAEIAPITGEGVSGVRFVAPANIVAVPSALAGVWRISLGSTKPVIARSINIERETAADGTARLKALVPDAAATGKFRDPVVGDDLLVGLALGPATPLVASRSFIEASLPVSDHGLVVTPRTEDFQLRRSEDGFVLVRPNGMSLSGADQIAQAGGTASMAPGFIDYKNWRLGPKVEFTNNLNRLRREAALEVGNPTAGVRKRLDLARFLVAWDLGAEAAGVLRQLKSDVVTMASSPELIGLEGAANVMMGHGKDALDMLSQPEVADDPASQLWAGAAAQQDGNAPEALIRFARGAKAINDFWPEQRARFLLANAQAALSTGDAGLASILASRARDEAQEEPTKLRSQLTGSRAYAQLGRLPEAMAGLTALEGLSDREVSTRATFEKALLAYQSGKASITDTVRILDGLRYAWRGDELELEILHKLGALYIQGGDIRSGLSTMASATSLRPNLPEARKLRDELAKQFTRLFLEGGANGMDPIQALALFYDFKDLAPIGPDGDRMVRGLAERLVALDLLPQATALLQHQVDKRLDGFPKAQVATDLAAIYLMDRRPEPALQAIWNSRVTQLPEALNAQRRMIEAAALAELGRTEHAIEIVEFDNGADASRLRAELYMRAGDWDKAYANAKATLPIAKTALEPEEAGEVLRTAVTGSMAKDNAGLRALVSAYGAAMGKTAYAEAFKVVTEPGVPDPAALQSAVTTLTGGSPYNGLMKRLRNRLTKIEAPVAFAAVSEAEALPPTPDAQAAPVAALLPDMPATNPQVLPPAGNSKPTEEAISPAITPPVVGR